MDYYILLLPLLLMLSRAYWIDLKWLNNQTIGIALLMALLANYLVSVPAPDGPPPLLHLYYEQKTLPYLVIHGLIILVAILLKSDRWRMVLLLGDLIAVLVAIPLTYLRSDYFHTIPLDWPLALGYGLRVLLIIRQPFSKLPTLLYHKSAYQVIGVLFGLLTLSYINVLLNGRGGITLGAWSVVQNSRVEIILLLVWILLQGLITILLFLRDEHKPLFRIISMLYMPIALIQLVDVFEKGNALIFSLYLYLLLFLLSHIRANSRLLLASGAFFLFASIGCYGLSLSFSDEYLMQDPHLDQYMLLQVLGKVLLCLSLLLGYWTLWSKHDTPQELAVEKRPLDLPIEG